MWLVGDGNGLTENENEGFYWDEVGYTCLSTSVEYLNCSHTLNCSLFCQKECRGDQGFVLFTSLSSLLGSTVPVSLVRRKAWMNIETTSLVARGNTLFLSWLLGCPAWLVFPVPYLLASVLWSARLLMISTYCKSLYHTVDMCAGQEQSILVLPLPGSLRKPSKGISEDCMLCSICS